MDNIVNKAYLKIDKKKKGNGVSKSKLNLYCNLAKICIVCISHKVVNQSKNKNILAMKVGDVSNFFLFLSKEANKELLEPSTFLRGRLIS